MAKLNRGIAGKKNINLTPQPGATPAPDTYKTKSGKTFVHNPNDRTSTFLTNHPVLAGLKSPEAKLKFFANHPKIEQRASEVTRAKGPALSEGGSYREAVLRRYKKMNAK